MEQGNTEHVPVMLEEVLAVLNLRSGMHVVDATLGGGGYTRAILERIGLDGKLIAIDWDAKAIERFRSQAIVDSFLSEALSSGRLMLVQSPFSRIRAILDENGWTGADAVAADLGLSSDQLADPARGISFQGDGPLDMRLNSTETVEARHLINQMSEKALADLFRTYGDEGEAERIATAIVAARKKVPIESTAALRELVWENVVPARRKGKTHPATKVFQALRIAVNSELTHLETFLKALPDTLTVGGRAAVVTFHSGEDTIVKHLFQQAARSETPRLRLLAKKSLPPSREEIRNNPRARSARLRSIERI
ncbi:MAG: 16S rRNA (cytosine(1402)-N(4))-methyltransferase RsmH [Undibacterium sp.]